MSDLISRQTVLRCIKESRDNIDWGQSEDGDAFLHYTGALYRTVASEECLPSAEPERKKGKWVPVHPLQSDDCGAYMCSKCKTGMWEIRPSVYHFCPNCGADMREGDA